MGNRHPLAEKRPAWEKAFSKERSFRSQLLLALLFSLAGEGLIFSIDHFLDMYVSSLAVVTVIFISLFTELWLGVFFSVLMSLSADYFFIPPIGSVLNTIPSFEHFFILVMVSAFVSYLGTTLRKAFKKTFQAKQEAEHASLMMEKMLALVSHDIRNPLNAIKMSADLVSEDQGISPRSQVFLKKMSGTVDRLDSMLRSLLDVSRINAGEGIQLEFQNCDLRLVLVDLADGFSSLYPKRIELAAPDACVGNWGVDGIYRAVENLVGNAVKYGDAKTPILIRLTGEKNGAVISVHNRGPVISATDQANLFDAFQRISAAENAKVKGWGLGLALVKGVVDAHQGKVSVMSTAETGTIFTLEMRSK
jgi:signal transduction histidine kinase